ncbi:kelch motif family protein, putative [Ichthyophthirius multifiliis]|uniref:Kelch motif family protein, putative n=1 Tax=Ichthyophthirius multifiliis TaxID=5932 RepID=G0QQK4_ICHMU|nr:kelch motif family protein, putative [Ichthyophthirius multifiliis]EGR32498.1 kelch motif family protein, putative [Ichthyophthirius multifiliis]|eukprot:XP_004036484.1 kelch motif family protein, putative [Ichthyophthirius multifiliis]
MKYSFEEEKMLFLEKMNIGRSSHSMVFLNDFIYVIGGFDENNQMTKQCEKFSLKNFKWDLAPSLNFGCASSAVCAFQNKFLFKFGGIGEDLQLSPYIECFDQERNSWVLLDPKIEKVPLNEFALLSSSSCVQINSNDILIFGGYFEDNTASNICFVFQVSDNVICFDGVQQLPIAEGFWNNNPVVCDGKVYAVQNVAAENSNNCIENERKVLTFFNGNWNIIC